MDKQPGGTQPPEEHGEPKIIATRAQSAEAPDHGPLYEELVERMERQLEELSQARAKVADLEKIAATERELRSQMGEALKDESARASATARDLQRQLDDSWSEVNALRERAAAGPRRWWRSKQR